LSNALVVVQIALCVTLVASAGLAQRSLYLIERFDAGFDRKQLMLVTVDTVASAANPEQSAALLGRLEERLRSTPGVLSVAYAVDAPLSFSGMSLGQVKGDSSREPVSTFGNIAGARYLRTLGVPLLAGRDLDERDVEGSKKVAVINQNLAEALWPGVPAVGRTVTVGKDVVEVAGIAPNGVFSGLQQRNRQNYMLLPYLQRRRAPGPMTFHVRYAGNLDAVARAIRA